MSEQKEIDYMTYVAIQKTLHEWINSVLPIISNFPVSYCYVQKIPAGDGDSLTMAFTPSGSIDMTDWTGDFCTITFMLQYKTITRDSSEQLACIGALQYLVDVLQSYPIQLGKSLHLSEIYVRMWKHLWYL